MTPHQPPFPSYLLPAFSFPFTRRKSSTTSNSSTSETSVPSLTSSPRSSFSTPSSSPTSASPLTAHSNLHHALQGIPESEEAGIETRLRKAAPNTLKCLKCSTDLAFTSQIVSKGFTGRHGRAYLVAPPPSSPLHHVPSTSLSSKNNGKPLPPPLPPTDLINTNMGRAVNRDLLTGAHVVADVSCRICNTILGWKYVDAREPSQRYKIGKFILEMKRVVPGVCWEDISWSQDTDNGEQDGYGEEEGNGIGDGVVVFDSEDEDECEDLLRGFGTRRLCGRGGIGGLVGGLR
ncbi:Protein yippee-like, partial [Lachnellula subtilissima]